MSLAASLTLPAIPLRLAPVFSERPWGGRKLEAVLGKALPQDGSPIGESWELSDHPSGRSTLATPPFVGFEFGDLLRRYPKEMIGRDRAPERYPLLVKFLDAREDLSIQVHPDNARSAEGCGKTECWYVMDAEPGTEIVFGLQEGVTADELRDGVRGGTLERLVRRLPIAPGTFLFVRAGTVHAILRGTLICEIQQCSDTTFRLYDWNRRPLRRLHVEEALQVTDFSAAAPEPLRLDAPGTLAEAKVLTDNEFFRVRAIDVAPGMERPLPQDLTGSGAILVCVGGKGVLAAEAGVEKLSAGATIFLPAICGHRARIKAEEPLRVLLAESREL